MELQRLVERTHQAGRCGYCHESLATGSTCGSCGAVLHDECLTELGRCPTLGCECRSFERSVPTEPLAPPSEEAIAAFVSAIRQHATSVFLGIASPFVGAFLIEAIFVAPDSLAALTMIALALAIAAVGALVLWAHVRNVNRLLRETEPRRAEIFVSSEPSIWNGATVYTGWVSERGRPTLALRLGSRPEWLAQLRDDTAVGIYGGGWFEPVVVQRGEMLFDVGGTSVRSLSRREWHLIRRERASASA